MMRAVMWVPRPSGAVAEVQEVPTPVPALGEALIKVRAAGLNRGQLIVRNSLKSGTPQPTGIEFAGEIAALGAGATRCTCSCLPNARFVFSKQKHNSRSPRMARAVSP